MSVTFANVHPVKKPMLQNQLCYTGHPERTYIAMTTLKKKEATGEGGGFVGVIRDCVRCCITKGHTGTS